ncbi:arsenate reductase (glutaredoxin) [Rhodococcus sp. IEGM 1408]|uniref:arsenate reductase (glutaredoxin) n=1 Tax=Rhodococcus sp. IEGM 1408 TaxID=3082220 RepID=UPI00295412E0|nr:arsenate reductase (glutaredoxin) [Rhodococcus sp. IEGM 1408]MDV8001078.1 arsenate reductase (glutaredoxin) [Rhodococcus sp. IEGM 1408]
MSADVAGDSGAAGHLGDAGDATIFHNPRCSKSRQALELLRERGVEPTIIKYLDTPPTVEELRTLISDAGLTVRQAVRVKEAEFTELGLLEASDDELLEAMVAHPKLIERPFVVTPKGTRLARPTAAVEDIL